MGPTTSGQFVIDFLLEENHIFTRQLAQNAGRPLSSEKTVEPGMGVGEIFSST